MMCSKSFLGLFPHKWDHLVVKYWSHTFPPDKVPLDGVSVCRRCYITYKAPPIMETKIAYGYEWQRKGKHWESVKKLLPEIPPPPHVKGAGYAAPPKPKAP